MEKRNDIGKNGESEARLFLERKGYRILHTNWHFHHYELDIVAQLGEELVIVEVKTRSKNYLLEPEEAVDTKKIRRIVAAADASEMYQLFSDAVNDGDAAAAMDLYSNLQRIISKD